MQPSCPSRAGQRHAVIVFGLHTVMTRWPSVVGGPWHAEMPARPTSARHPTVAGGTGERDGNGRDRGGQVAQEATRRVVLAAAVSLPLVATGCSKGIGGLGSPPSPLPGVTVLRDAIVG